MSFTEEELAEMAAHDDEVDRQFAELETKLQSERATARRLHKELKAVRAERDAAEQERIAAVDRLLADLERGRARFKRERRRAETAEDETRKLAEELRIAFGPRLYADVSQVLDRALGTRREDGAGAGIVAEVSLVADRMAQAEAANAALRSAVDEANRRIALGLASAAELHEFNSPEGEHLDGCRGCRLEEELGAQAEAARTT
ncbi:hypothetical protein GCM10010402_66390 [Actinomadura luteofluorescens]|uniref:hypothetical protein n=1 Tax=Actinomadura luteofluorescens TaxID=46163 RepID=UPI002164D0AE|nr:hypothetical protein [Actinomadura glauciflava]MCR3744189.1 hypothetical protein [Actinomadura glauciflava]